MSQAATQDRVRKQSWAAPGGAHDWVVRAMKLALPALIGVLIAFLAFAPLSKQREISFILDKNKVDRAPERMRLEAAQYRGEDNEGRPFQLNAAAAVQPTAREPFVNIRGMAGELALTDGPARLSAGQARYNMDEETVAVIGPILFAAADGYRIASRDVAVDLNSQVMSGTDGVEGQLPLGRFSADAMRADLADRRVVLTGRARLHIEQGAIR